MVDARAFIGAFLQDSEVQVPPAAVVDIGHLRGDGWAVIESNPAFSSGLYGCDPHDVLPVLLRSVARDERDLAWVVER